LNGLEVNTQKRNKSNISRYVTAKKKKQAKRKYKKYQKKLNTRTRLGNCRRNSSCPEPIVGETRYCLKHWTDLIRNNSFGNEDKLTFNVLDLWLEQEGRCKITNVPLIPGKTASLDHIIPVSKGGSNDRDNLRFVHHAVNAFKNSMDEIDFKQTLRDLAPLLLEWANK